MDLAPPSAGSAPVLEPPPSDELGPPKPVIGGVAATLATRLDVDALWIRLAFVLLALVGGLGVLLYGALWLAFVVGASPDRRWARIVGGAVLVAGLPLLLSSGFTFFDGPLAVLGLLVGLAIALWQPRASAAAARWAPPAGPPPETTFGDVAGDEQRPPLHGTPRPTSILGRLTLGVAVLVAAIGALIDHANDGRLHPEQWLGAGAVLCGAGLLVGAVFGRALWLAVPAVLFAAAGFVAGEAARIGVDPTMLIGEESLSVDDGDGGGTKRAHVAIGTVDIDVDDAPRNPVAIDARVAVGPIEIDAADDVTVEVRAQVDHGTIEVDGVERSDGTFTVGPEGAPDVVVTAVVARGDVDVETFDAGPRFGPVPLAPEPQLSRSTTFVAEGVTLSDDGDLVLAGGEAVVSPNGDVIAGSSTELDGMVVVETSIGEFRLLTGEVLVTPSGEVINLPIVVGDITMEGE